MRYSRLRQEERPINIRLHRPIELLGRDVQNVRDGVLGIQNIDQQLSFIASSHTKPHHNARVVDQNIDLPKVRQEQLDDPLASLLETDVLGDEKASLTGTDD